MSIAFLYPRFLWLLSLIPILIGLGLLGQRAQSKFRLWAGLIIRTILMVAIILALAGVQLRVPSKNLTTAFLLDVSDSIPIYDQTRGEEFIRQAIQSMPEGDKAAVIVFGQEALIERLPSEDRLLNDLASIPITSRTDVAGALQLAQAILPGEGAKRIVLLSDGRENIQHAMKQAEIAATQGIELLYVPLGNPQEDVEVFLEHVNAPNDVRQGQEIPVTILIQSSHQVRSDLQVFLDNNLFTTRELELQPGLNEIEVAIGADAPVFDEARESGFHRISVQVIPDFDKRLQNNQASAFTIVHGPPAILLVEGQTGEGDNLARVLESASMRVERVSPSDIPTSLPELANYEAIILVNTHAGKLPSGVMDLMPIYIRDLGRGFLMIGGAEAYGAGGYLRTPLEKALPVDMDVKDKDLQANLALVVSVDKSGSMGRCHCDNPDLNQSYTRKEVGQPKVDIAKEAIMRAANALGEQDYLGVVTFDNQARWALKVDHVVDPLKLEQAIASFQAEGQTNLQAGVQAAYQALQGVTARKKHIILMTDGWVRQGDLTSLAQQMQEEGITLSVVAAGEGSAEYLAALSQIGGGRFYPATDLMNVPDIILKETIQSVGEYIIEEPFYPLPAAPSPVLRGLDMSQMPPLLGYNGTSAKNTARLDLLTSRGDPLLATWQYGLGRSATWTSDLKGQWAIEWLNWDGFSRFLAQLVGWLLPTPKVEGLEAHVEVEEGLLKVYLDAMDHDGRPLNFLEGRATFVSPELETSQLPLEQIASGKYQATIEAPISGTYLIRVGVNDEDQSLGQITLGAVVPYSPEYKSVGVDRHFLSFLASITGGGEASHPASSFQHNIPARSYVRELWSAMLLAAILLFPFDVAVRRLKFSQRDLEMAVGWITEKIKLRPTGRIAQPQIMHQLFQARDRVRLRQASGKVNLEANGLTEDSGDPLITRDEIKQNTVEESYAKSKGVISEPASTDEDALARLRKAKQRAKR